MAPTSQQGVQCWYVGVRKAAHAFSWLQPSPVGGICPAHVGYEGGGVAEGIGWKVARTVKEWWLVRYVMWSSVGHEDLATAAQAS